MSERRCCCGKRSIPEDEAAVIYNDYRHEPLDSRHPENFCGPSIHHDVRDLRARATAAESLADRLAEQLRDVAAQNRCGCGHPACNRCADDEENAKALAAYDAAKGERR